MRLSIPHPTISTLPGCKCVLNESGEGKVELRGVSVHTPTSADELLEMLHKGNSERTQTP